MANGMESINISSDMLMSQPAFSPLVFNLIVSLSLFLVAVVYSALILWLILRFFNEHKSRNRVKTAFLVSLISNVAASLLFGIVIQVARRVLGQPVSSNAALSVAVTTLGFAIIFVINLLVGKKFYMLPARQAFHVILIWTAISFLATNMVSPFLGPLIADFVTFLFPSSVPTIVLK